MILCVLNYKNAYESTYWLIDKHIDGTKTKHYKKISSEENWNIKCYNVETQTCVMT